MHSHKHGTEPLRGANGSYGGSARCSALSGVRALREFNPLIFPRGGLQNICKNVELNLPFGNSLKLHPLLNSPQRQVALHVLLIVNKRLRLPWKLSRDIACEEGKGVTGKAINVPTPCFSLRTAKIHQYSMMVLAERCLAPLFLSRLDPWLYQCTKGENASIIVETDGMGQGGGVCGGGGRRCTLVPAMYTCMMSHMNNHFLKTTKAPKIGPCRPADPPYALE